MSDRPLRILHLTAGSDAGGLSRYIFDLCSAMQSHGHQTWVAGERGAWHWLFEKAPFPWIDLPLKGGLLAMLRMPGRIAQIVQDLKIDLIHSHYRKPTWTARRVRPPHRRPVLYTLHLSHISLAFPRNLFTDFGDHTHVASADARQWMIDRAKLPPDRITLIPHGIDPAKFPLADDATRAAARATFGLSADDHVAAFVGRLDVPKNEDWLLDVASSNPRLQILVAGQGPHETDFRLQLTDRNLLRRVKMLGHVDPLPVYQAADLLLLPSSREGFSLVCAEAMSVGVPVLRMRTSGTRELIIEGVTGRSCPIKRTAFVAAATEMLQDRTTLRQMGIAAARHVRDHLTFDRQLSQTLALYRRLVEDDRG